MTATNITIFVQISVVSGVDPPKQKKIISTQTVWFVQY